MESIINFLQILDALGFSLLNIVLICMLYFMGAQSGMFPRFWSSEENKKGVTIAQLHQEMTQLKAYFNHETTDQLKKVNSELENIGEGVKKIDRRHDEYEKYGIKVRKEV